MTYESKTIPLTKDIKARFGLEGCRKRKVNIVQTENMTCYDCFWSGGTKKDYWVVDTIGQSWSLPMPSSPFGGESLTTVKLGDDKCVVEFGYFCGEVTSPTIYVHDIEAWGL